MQRRFVGIKSPKKLVLKKENLSPVKELLILNTSTLNNRRKQKQRFLQFAPKMENFAPTHKVKVKFYFFKFISLV